MSDSKKSLKSKNKSHKFFNFLNRFFVILLLLAQALVFLYLIKSSSDFSIYLAYALKAISIIVIFHIISIREKSGFKLIWAIIVSFFPLFGGITYLVFHLQGYTRRFKREMTALEFSSRSDFLIPDSAFFRSQDELKNFSTNVFYLQQTVGFPVFEETSTEYFSSGEKFLPCYIEELKKAEKYIFLEYFIIDNGVMWDSIFEVLKEKAAKGVDVRIMYDDVGSFLLHSYKFPKELRSYGIKCRIFNRFVPFFLVSQNNRDHRKITVIDGKVAFTGGLNLADEYINKKDKFGYWKDSAVMMKGKAAWSFAVVFLQLWKFQKGDKNEVDDIESFFPWKEEKCFDKSDGFVQPFADSPTDKENVGEHVYLHMIHNAKNYLYIETPYFIVDDSFVSALILAAKSGVDVRIILPYHWDKFFVKQISRSYYHELVSGGVRVFEYQPGFMHSKIFISDDSMACVGTINLDYRSLYHHFEDGCCLYNTNSVLEVKKDFEKTFEECIEISIGESKPNIFKRAFQNVLRAIAPLL